jgi:thiamine phosphate synthase YjbQ (UPF0047 family)
MENGPADAAMLRQSLHQLSLHTRGELRSYRHDDEGPDDMPAHIRTALTCTTLALPFRAGGC